MCHIHPWVIVSDADMWGNNLKEMCRGLWRTAECQLFLIFVFENLFVSLSLPDSKKRVCHATFNTDRCISLFPPLITHTHTHALLWQLQSQASPVSHQPYPCLWSEQFRLWSALVQGWRKSREWNLSGKNQRLVQNVLNHRLHKQLRVCCGSLWDKCDWLVGEL